MQEIKGLVSFALQFGTRGQHDVSLLNLPSLLAMDDQHRQNEFAIGINVVAAEPSFLYSKRVRVILEVFPKGEFWDH